MTSLLIITLIASQAVTPPAYHIEDLGTLGGELANAFSINDVGNVCGQAENPGLGTQGFYWKNGEMFNLGAFSGPTGYSRANALNDLGFVVGNAMIFVDPGYMPKAFIWHEDTGLVDLGPDMTPWSTGTGINNAGQVCGYKTGSSGGPFVWTQETGAVFYSIGGPSGWSSDPTGINENGIVAGYGWNADYDLMAYSYDSTSGEVTFLPGLDDSNTTWGINNFNEIAGSPATPEEWRKPVYWTAEGELIVLPILAEPHYIVHGEANGINDDTWIVGSDWAEESGHLAEAWLWIDGEKWRLKDLAVGEDSADWEITWAFDINNSGQIVGIGIHEGYQGRAFRMTPVQVCPEDVVGDGVVDVLDLLAVLAAWGQTEVIEDINGDGIVDVLDLLQVLSAWGPCGGLPVGACCLPSGDCEVINELECNLAKGQWYGPESDCETVSCPIPPDGDLIENAIAVEALPYSTDGDTTGLRDDYDEWCPYFGSSSPDIVYSYTPAADVTVTISLCGDSGYDTKVYIYENGEDHGNPIACNDDACTTASVPEPIVSELTGVALATGNTYYIVVDGYGGDFGYYTLDITVD